MRKPDKVLLLHSYPPTPCLYGFEKGLKALGHEVVCVGPRVDRAYEEQFRRLEPECEYIEAPAPDVELSRLFELAGGALDWVLLLQPDGAFLPRGLRDCPVPTIAWWTHEAKYADIDQSLYYYFDAAPTVLGSYSNTCHERGLDNCPCFNFIGMNWLQPEVVDGDRPIDVAFVGSLNRALSRLRGRELEKLLQLSDEGIEVVVREGVYLDHMLDLYARSKIVWQHSGQGGNNLTFRVSEAMSAGALVLAPRPYDFAGLGDGAIEDGTHLVFYDDFDEARDLIRHYIAHEDERRHIADAGLRHLTEERPWLGEVERFVDEVVDAIPPDFLGRRHERLRRHGVDARRERMDYARYFFMYGEFAVARRLYEDTPDWSEDATLLHHRSLAAVHEGQQVDYLGVVHEVLSEHPDHLIALFNCVCVVCVNRSAMGATNALRALRQLLTAMQRSDPGSWTVDAVEGPYIAVQMRRLRLEIAQAYLDFPRGMERWRRLRDLYVHETLRNVGVLLAECERWEDAIIMFRNALRILPDEGPTMAQEALAWSTLGIQDRAAALYARAVESEPFFWGERAKLAQIWIDGD
ncbi:glycosyltransferase family 1 protein, partial [Candidatus Poribacteria bacterium]|nr:glycosyltransferase family 1 protein [Candidatus Poribacteria bacterium]